jgi:hypothetical protein
MRAGGGAGASGVRQVGRRALAAHVTVGLAAVGAVAGCGGDEPAPPVTVTVTVTPSAKLRGAKPPDSERSIEGRRHDVGTIVAARGSGRSRVLVLDRWSVRGMKFEVRCSPPLRRKRSTSGRSGSSRYLASSRSSTFSGSSRPAATSRATARAASAISARPP